MGLTSIPIHGPIGLNGDAMLIAHRQMRFNPEKLGCSEELCSVRYAEGHLLGLRIVAEGEFLRDARCGKR